jgi:AraC family transcriptional regulator
MSITSRDVTCMEFKPQASIVGQESDSLRKPSDRQIGGDSFSMEQLRGALSGLSTRATAVIMRGGLTSWQIAKVMTHLEANMSVSIQIADLAKLVGVNSSRFCHAFKQSFGISPHGYLMRRRVERAQKLMLATGASLSQIAADCGLADQSHFTKLFRRFVGESPAAWRRARVPAQAR